MGQQGDARCSTPVPHVVRLQCKAWGRHIVALSHSLLGLATILPLISSSPLPKATDLALAEEREAYAVGEGDQPKDRLQDPALLTIWPGNHPVNLT